ncbi:hypothetical protein BE21_15455 [Sorangium cellulosum]|uniref:Secreted protein n=1 Tax=Sorangium cellulosum TaxID=56 RepID=A0A150TYW2_SORCE|nr:hypothetical protein BE21_15455 [Sorangium cellulosum]
MRPSAAQIARFAALLSGAVLAACGGSQHAGAAAFWEGGTVDPSKPAEPDAAQKAPRRAVGTPDDFDGAPSTPEERAPSSWVGVRHDLALARAASRAERCSCLAVEVAEARDPRFQWAAGAPETSADTLAVALSARGVPCPGGPADEELRRPSISAVDQEGNDVIIEVEELPPGRPLATGAVIPRPAKGGAIYVKGRSARVPYARAAGGARCKVY